MNIIGILKRYSIFRWLVGALCALLLVATMPRKASAQDLIEYGLLTAIISLIFLSAVVVDTGGWQNARAHLQTTADAAALANEEGNRPKEISRLGKTNGTAHAMLGMTSSCDERCDEVRGQLQDVVGLSSLLKQRALGQASDCRVDGVIGSNEECDPMAEPTGCSFRTAFCDDECQCQIIRSD